MNKYISLLKYEAKTIIRDPINLYMCLFPIIIHLLSSFVFPIILESIDPMQSPVLRLTMLLLLIIILAFGSFFLAAMAAFLLLDQKDEHTLHTIAVTPVGTSYLKFKMAIYNVCFGYYSNSCGNKLIAGDKYMIGGSSVFDNVDISHIVSFL